MRSFYMTRIALSLGILWVGASASAQDSGYSSPSLLPMPSAGPQMQGYPMMDPNAALNASPYSQALYRHQVEAVPGQPMPDLPGQVAPSPPMTAGPAQPAQAGNCCENDCDAALCSNWCNDCCVGCCPQWFAGFTGLVLTRDNPNPFWTTYETNVNTNQLMNTKDAEADWRGGGEIRFGRWGCASCTGRNGVEFSYFTVDTLEGFASLRDPGDALSTPIDLNTQTGTFDIGTRPAADFFDNSREHRIWREDEIHNVEINLLRQTLVSNHRTQVTWIAGVRYFRFDESLIFGAVAGANAITPNAEFGNNGGVDEAYLSIRCENNLVGPQLGIRGDYYINDRISVYAAPKFGMYGNSINHRARLATGSGIEAFDIETSENHFSLLGSLDIGGTYQFSNHWRGFMGYRVIGATNIALGDNQIPAFMAALDEFADVDTNGSLLVHGAMGGIECRY